MCKKRTPAKVTMQLITEDSVIVYLFFLLLTDLKSNYVKQYLYNCIAGRTRKCDRPDNSSKKRATQKRSCPEE